MGVDQPSGRSTETPPIPGVVAERSARFLVAYRGTRFRGFAANAGVRTVEGVLADAFSTIVRRPVDITCAGRTDAGVHAWGQVITLSLPVGTDLESLAARVNKLCRPDISIREPSWVGDDFDARFSATSRTYRYQVWNDPVPNPLLADQVWHVPKPIDTERVDRAAADLVGEHDFASFCRRPTVPPGAAEPSLVRIVYSASWRLAAEQPLLTFEVTASAFCHQQVRSMVGTCVDIGLGRLPADAIKAILAARDRNAAGQVAPPQGLTLWEVGYEGDRWDA